MGKITLAQFHYYYPTPAEEQVGDVTINGSHLIMTDDRNENDRNKHIHVSKYPTDQKNKCVQNKLLRNDVNHQNMSQKSYADLIREIKVSK